MKLKVLIMSVVLLFSLPALAVSTEGLTKAQAAEIEAKVAAIKAENASKPPAEQIMDQVPEIGTLEKVAAIAPVIAKTVGQTARELGMAVDEFAKTDLGSLVVWLVLYNYLGAELIRFVFGFGVIMPLTIWLATRAINFVRTNGYEWDEKAKVNRPVYYKWDELDRSVSNNMTSNIMTISVFTAIILICQVFMFLP